METPQICIKDEVLHYQRGELALCGCKYEEVTQKELSEQVRQTCGTCFDIMTKGCKLGIGSPNDTVYIQP